jgi:hypothetical protein
MMMMKIMMLHFSQYCLSNFLTTQPQCMVMAARLKYILTSNTGGMGCHRVGFTGCDGAEGSGGDSRGASAAWRYGWIHPFNNAHTQHTPMTLERSVH